MRRRSIRGRPLAVPRYAGFWRLLLLLLVMGLSLSNRATVGAAEQPDRGGTIIWAVHEGMSHFDMHVEGSYILAQPVGPLYNSLLTFDLYNNEKIVGDLAERIRISMPQGNEGSLGRQQVSDIMAAIFAANEYPAAQMELPKDLEPLKLIQITSRKP